MRAKGTRAIRRAVGVLAILSLAFSAAACGGSGSATPAAQDTGPVTLHLGYFPNLTHAPAMIGLEKGFFSQELGSQVTIRTATFNAGPEAVTAMLSGALDIAYIGPNPAINAYAQSNRTGIRIIAGATSGGAALVVKPGITSAAQLKGKKIASPQLGNTQDVALRAWLTAQGVKVTKEGGEVTIVAQANSQTLDTFKNGTIDGAWVPEPWATRLQQEGGGTVLVDEKTLWPGGRFVTTHVIVRTQFLTQHPGVVERFLRGHVKAVEFAASSPDEAKTVVNSSLEKLTGKALKKQTIDAAWSNLLFTVDPIASSLRKSAADAQKAGLLDPVDLSGIYSLDRLNAVLTSLGKPTVGA